MLYLECGRASNLTTYILLDSRKIKKKSANYQLFLQQFLKIIAFKSKLKLIINIIKESKSN